MPLIAIWNVWQLIVDLADWPQNASQLFNNFGQTHFVLGSVCSNRQTKQKPDFDTDTADTYFVSCYTDDDRSSVFEPLDELPACETPQTAFKGSPPTFSELTSVLKRNGNSSSSGPNGVPYIVWKMCPSLQKRLLTIICRVWKNKSIPFTCQQAIIILLHKSSPSSSPANFRPIALTSCDGKLFLLHCS